MRRCLTGPLLIDCLMQIMKIISTITSVCAAMLAVLMASCSNGIDESTLEADRICALADAAFTTRNFSDVLAALEKRFPVDAKKMRITDQGIFIPVRSRFVEERGYFVARPGVNIVLKSGDPAMVRVKACVFRYRIKG